MTLAHGVLESTSAAASCADTVPVAGQAPAAALDDAAGGVSIRYGSGVEPGDGATVTLVVTCSYEIDAPLAEPATCNGTATWDLAATSTNAAVVAAPLTPNQEIAIAVDGDPVEAARLPGQDVTCTVQVEMQSQASTAGPSVHHVVVVAAAARGESCQSDGECAGGRCNSSSGTCRDGGSGTPCLGPYDPATQAGDCNAEAPICNPFGSCQDGREFDACGGSDAESSVFCARGFTCVGTGFDARCQPEP